MNKYNQQIVLKLNNKLIQKTTENYHRLLYIYDKT